MSIEKHRETHGFSHRRSNLDGAELVAEKFHESALLTPEDATLAQRIKVTPKSGSEHPHSLGIGVAF